MKIIKVEYCNNCPFNRYSFGFQNAIIYYCFNKNKELKNYDITKNYIVPKDCPLEDYKEESK